MTYAENSGALAMEPTLNTPGRERRTAGTLRTFTALLSLATAAVLVVATTGPVGLRADEAPAPAPVPAAEPAPPAADPILQARVLRALPDDAILAAYIHDLKQTRERLLKTGIVGVLRENDVRRLLGLLPEGAQAPAATWYTRLGAVLEKQLSGEIAFALVPPDRAGGPVEPLALIQVDDLAVDLYDAMRSNLKLAGHWSDLPVKTEDLDGVAVTTFSSAGPNGQPQDVCCLALAKSKGHACLILGVSRMRVTAAAARFVKDDQPSQLAQEMLRSGVVVPDLIVQANKAALERVNAWLTHKGLPKLHGPAEAAGVEAGGPDQTAGGTATTGADTGAGAAGEPTGLDAVDSVSYSFSIDGKGFREAILFHCSQRAGWLEALTHAPLSDRAFAGAPTTTLALVATTIPIKTQGAFFRAFYDRIPNSWGLRDKIAALWPENLSLDFDRQVAPALTGEWSCWVALDPDVPKPSLTLRLTQADKAKATALFDAVDGKLQALLQPADGAQPDKSRPTFRHMDADYRNFVVTPPQLWFMADTLLEPTVFITNNDLFVCSQTRDALESMRLMTALNQVSLADTDDFQQLRKMVSPHASTLIYIDLKRVTKILYELVATTKLAGNVDLPPVDTFVSHLDNVIIGLSAGGDAAHPTVLVESYAPIGPVLLTDAVATYFLAGDKPAAPPEAAKQPAGMAAPK